MPSVLTLRVATTVPATQDTRETGGHAHSSIFVQMHRAIAEHVCLSGIPMDVFAILVGKETIAVKTSMNAARIVLDVRMSIHNAETRMVRTSATV